MSRGFSITLAAGLLFWAAGAAEARPDTRTMTCGQTRALIQSRHAVVLTTGRDTYERFVRQFGNECDWPEVPVSASVSTRDGQCLVYRCGQPTIPFPD